MSIILAAVMIVGLFPVAAFAEDGSTTASEDSVASATIRDGDVQYYTTLEAAVNAATDGGTVTLLKDITLDAAGKTNTQGILTITKALTINGDGKTITAKNVAGTPSMINIQNGAKVMINDLIIDGGTDAEFKQGTKHGLNINQAGTVTLNDVIIKNNSNYAVMNNGSALVINGLTTSGNQWGINVDSKAGNASIVVNNANIAEASSIVLEKSSSSNEEPVATINGGSLQYIVAQGGSTATGLTVNGGQFATGGTAPKNVVDVKYHVAPGNTLDESGQVVIDATTAVASVDDVGYTSLQAAIDAAEKINGTVTLLKNVELTDGVIVGSNTITLDLNGFTISDSAEWKPGEKVDYLLSVKRGADLTINDSSVAKTGAITTQRESIYCAVKLTLPADSGNEKATLTVNGGTLTGYYYGISGNGTRHNTDITINGGTVEGTNGTGIYHPQDGALEVNGGSVIGLNSAIELRSGKLTISDGTFISKASVYEAEPNGSGTTVSGAAIAVSQHTTKKDINVTITGGTFRGPKAFVETGVQGTPEDIALTINGGTFESAVESDDITNFIESGHFANPVDSTLLADNLNTQLTDADNAVAPYSYYSSVQAAVNAADEGDTVTILVNSDEDVTVSKPIKIETADSVVYTGTVSAGNGYDVVIGEDGVITIVKEPEYTGKYSYEIFTKVGDNGTIDVDRYATEGDKVTITVSPDEAYMLDEMTITSGGKDVEVTDNGDGTYTFTMPSGDVKIEVTFAEDPNWEEEPAMPFVDVNENDWFYDVVLYAYENGLMTGTSADTFAPNTATTRGMIVSMLARLEGVTSAESAGFVDVADSDWYATAVNWAASEGIVNGFEDDTFRPNDAITREQMAAILYNYADYKGYDVSARADLSDYADAASISSWAEDVLAWANAEGLINGMTATTIDPQGATTRAQTAAMFERFLTAHAE